ncbi:MAG: hypothetical protein QNI90_02825 [Dinoroseobacter sp.]|nr:hypothetical protein [Dinoroseobacter sp.]
MRDAKLKIALMASVLLVAPLLFWAAAEFAPPRQQSTYTAPGLDPMGPEAARDDLFTLLPALLLVVYDAFGRTEEGEIYDTLAVVATGKALEMLYLERAGAMVGGGLTENDQAIHEMRLTKASSQQSGDTFLLDAQWEVIGTVGHSEHIHVRGNTYSANLTIMPVEGAWKITDFELTDVDRQMAGEFMEAERSWWN